MLRMRFEKTGNGIWISHLDLMRVFQRAFRRSGLLLQHTQGYNPHAFVSIALPLPVGTESRCELLEFALAGGEPVELSELPRRLNRALPAGIRCLEAYEGGRKLKELTDLQVEVALEYDGGVPTGAAEAVMRLFSGDRLLVQKKSKNGPVEQDILPMIRTLSTSQPDGCTLLLEARICAQNPSLNPDLLAKAVTAYLPDMAPDFAKSTRVEIYDRDGVVFR